MIDCPICHVMNEDMARFCAECGQRLTPGGQPAAAAAPPPSPGPAGNPGYPGAPGGAPGGAMPQQRPVSAPPSGSMPAIQPNPGMAPGLAAQPPRPAEPPKPAQKLHSPLLSGDDFPEPEPPSRGGAPAAGGRDFSRLRGTGGPAPAAPSGRKGLHSPLLGGDDDFPDAPLDPPSGSGRRKGLHSPLLQGDDAEDYMDTAPRGQSKPSGKGGLRSPLLGGMDDDEPMPQSQSKSRGGGLHSPLLGGGSDIDYNAPAKPRNFGGGSPAGSHGGPKKLHSPILGDSYDDYDEPDYNGSADVDDPNVLRSPLLAAKVPLTEKPSPAKHVRIPDHVVDEWSGVSSGPEMRGGDMRGGNVSVSGGGPSPNPMPMAPNPAPMPSPSSGVPTSFDPAPRTPLPTEQPMSPTGQRIAKTSMPSMRPPAPGPSPEPPAAVEDFSPMSKPMPAPSPATPLPEMSSPTTRKVRSRMLADDEMDAPPATSRDRYMSAPPSQPAMPGMLKLFIVPLAGAVLLKLYLTAQYLPQPGFMTLAIDQILGAITCIVLIIICMNSGK